MSKSHWKWHHSTDSIQFLILVLTPFARYTVGNYWSENANSNRPQRYLMHPLGLYCQSFCITRN